ncbi:hypothetical protein [Amycolatopsis thermoflava]|uniref:hypothetical protein n=1 Tax=Amycolatopsis thermoflava TaxID=84480 RepID=UPI003F49BAA5
MRGPLAVSMVAMTRRAMSKEGEDEARRLVESVRGVPVTPWDDGGGRGSRYDFNIGEDGALEVTSLADGGAEGVLRRASRATTSRPSSRLTRTWLVMVDLPKNFGLTEQKTEFRGLADRIEEQLVEMERRGESEMSRWSSRVQSLCGDESCPFHGLARLRVVSATAFDVKGLRPPEIFLSLAHGQVCHGPNDLPEAIEQCLADKPDNWRKLQVPGKTDRQVFFWARRSRWSALRALQMDELPSRAPDVEKYGITGVWAGILGRWDKALFWSATTGWVRVQMDENAESS